MISEEIRQRVEKSLQEWMNDPVFSPEIKGELTGLSEDELIDRFYCGLEFGTAGLRGVMGAGTNRMNPYVVRRATQGVAEAILADPSPQKTAVIAYDSRLHSGEYALEAALVLAANGVKAYLFDSLRPTPELSFALRKLGCTAGINITASHNPAEYNGYKVYWADGAQIGPDKAGEIALGMEKAGWAIPQLTQAEALAQGLLEYIGADIDEAYLAAVTAQALDGCRCQEKGQNLHIVYTPLHGAGRDSVLHALAALGFSHVELVQSQSEPDGNFPTVAVPNPEDPAAFTLALAQAKASGAQLVLATDPDADRVGMYARNKEGEYRAFTGNEVGALLAEFILNELSSRNALPKDGVMVKSLVSTAILKPITQAYGVELWETPVGFKYIGEKIKEMEATGKGTFLLGFEESLGYLKGTYTRDKDAVLAVTLLAEAALYYQEEKGLTLPEVMAQIYETYGYYLDEQKALTLKGIDGQERIQGIMTALRQDKRPCLGGVKVLSKEDFSTGLSYQQGKEIPLSFPKSYMLRYYLAEGGFVMARPSGTEPKIRIYFCVSGENRSQAEQNLAQVQEDLLVIVAPFLA